MVKKIRMCYEHLRSEETTVLEKFAENWFFLSKSLRTAQSYFSFKDEKFRKLWGFIRVECSHEKNVQEKR